ncbi:rodlin [Streptomyces sp. NPDC049577]|uniref:rodlin n=1 Tax=Streptomyces sp. NPDC049577 TaxID=3155153 RepID=UPI0034371F96
MIKKVVAMAAVAMSAVGGAAGSAAAYDHGGQDVANANGAAQVYGNTYTGGYMSPQIGLIQGSFNKPCIAVGDLGILSIQDILLLSSNQQMQCNENSVINDGDDPLSHILDDIPILSGNGSGNHEGLLHGRGRHRRH